jgi:hypothetical protein
VSKDCDQPLVSWDVTLYTPVQVQMFWRNVQASNQQEEKAAIWHFFLQNITELLSEYLASHPRRKVLFILTDYGLLGCDPFLFGGLLLIFQSDMLPSHFRVEKQHFLPECLY